MGQRGAVSSFTRQVCEQEGLLETLGWLGCDLGYKEGMGRQWLPAWVPRVAEGAPGRLARPHPSRGLQLILQFDSCVL